MLKDWQAESQLAIVLAPLPEDPSTEPEGILKKLKITVKPKKPPSGPGPVQEKRDLPAPQEPAAAAVQAVHWHGLVHFPVHALPLV